VLERCGDWPGAIAEDFLIIVRRSLGYARVHTPNGVTAVAVPPSNPFAENCMMPGGGPLDYLGRKRSAAWPGVTRYVDLRSLLGASTVATPGRG